MRWLAAAVLLLGACFLAQADDQASAGRVSDAQLFALLQGLGLDSQKTSDTLFRTSVRHDHWTLPVHFSLSRSGERIWIYAFLGEIKDPEKAPAGRLIQLLGAHDEIAPAHFYLTDGGKRLHIGIAADNRAVTPPTLRNELEQLCAAVSATADRWDVGNWTPPGTIEEKKAPDGK